MSSQPASSDAMSIPEALQRAYAHWNAGQADQAELLCQRVLAAWPGQSDALHLMGLMAHAYGNLDLAITHLRTACMAPRAPAVYSSNLAEMLRQKGQLAEGEEAAQRAVSAEPTLVAAWNNLGILQQEAGKLEQSLASLERVIALTPDSPEAHNNLANTYRRLDRLDRAQTHYERALALHPSYAEAHSNLAFLLSSLGHYERGAAEARLAIDLNPRLPDAYVNLADAEISRRRYPQALAAIDSLLAFAPQHAGALVARAKVLRLCERHEEALEYARRAIALAPQSAEAHNVLGQVLQGMLRHDEAMAAFEAAATLPGTVAEEALTARATALMEAGKNEEAMAAFDRVLARFPHSVQALMGRADAKKFKPGDPDIAAVEAFLAEGERRSLADRTAAHFVLGKAYMDSGEPALAFMHLNAGNRQKRASFEYDAAATEAWMQHIAAVCTPAWLRGLIDGGAGAPSTLPVFIVGMPRSGTTLIEQILASHPQVMGAGELNALRNAAEKLGALPEAFAGLAPQAATAVGRDYLARVTPLAQGRARVVDKMPANFLHAGLIAAALPGARIIHSRRDGVDTCLSCYSKLFAGEQLFTYDFGDLGRFYRGYEALMAHWRTVLPPQCFIEVDYEDVVDDLEGQARRLIDFLGLPWDEACLNFHQSRRVVRTASMNQVRQPIYSSSKGRWRQYAGHLGPLLAALGVEAR